MDVLLTFAMTLGCTFIAGGCWLGWQLLRQNGRVLLRLDEVEKQLDQLKFGEAAEPEGSVIGQTADHINARPHPGPLPQGKGEARDRAARFSNHSLARSRIKRDGLKAGTVAPDFRLPRLDGGELSIYELRGKRVLLVFSDPHCGPCNALAPHLEKFHQENCHSPVASATHPGTTGRPLTPSLSPSQGERVSEGRVRGTPPITVVMISRGEPKQNRAKVKEHGLTFPVVLQQRWEISRLYAMFATPIAYLVGEDGVIANDVAVGVEPILSLMNVAAANGIPCSTTEVNSDQVMTESKV
jgi:peroxiredoxin